MTAGPTNGALPPGGWETADGNLRGHYCGHFLSALALAYAGGAGDAFKDKLDSMVGALGECQAALAAQVGSQPTAARVPGRLGNARSGWTAATSTCSCRPIS